MAKMLAREAMQPVLDLRDHKSFRTEKWLVQALYAVGKENKAFLHTRFGLGNDVLEPYKATISRWVCPDVMRNQDYSVAKTKKAISDYKKAVGHAEGLAELSIFYCVSCRDFLGFCSVDDEVFFRPWFGCSSRP